MQYLIAHVWLLVTRHLELCNDVRRADLLHVSFTRLTDILPFTVVSRLAISHLCPSSSPMSLIDFVRLLHSARRLIPRLPTLGRLQYFSKCHVALNILRRGGAGSVKPARSQPLSVIPPLPPGRATRQRVGLPGRSRVPKWLIPHKAGQRMELTSACNDVVITVFKFVDVEDVLKRRRKREIPEETRPPAALSGKIHTCENPGETRPEIEPGSPFDKPAASKKDDIQSEVESTGYESEDPVDDSDVDPTYDPNEGHCGVPNCDVETWITPTYRVPNCDVETWSSCHRCLALLCYNDFIHVGSCSNSYITHDVGRKRSPSHQSQQTVPLNIPLLEEFIVEGCPREEGALTRTKKPRENKREVAHERRTKGVEYTSPNSNNTIPNRKGDADKKAEMQAKFDDHQRQKQSVSDKKREVKEYLDPKNCHFFTWRKGIAKRGSCEVATCLRHYLQERDNAGAKNVTLFSDGCPELNKNSIVTTMLLHTVCNFKNMGKIPLNFFEPYHGQNEEDSAHSCINTAIAAAADLYAQQRRLMSGRKGQRYAKLSQRRVTKLIESKCQYAFVDVRGSNISISVSLRETGLPYRDISARTGHAATTVMRVWSQWIEEVRAQRRVGTGPRNVTAAQDDAHLVRIAVTDLTASSTVFLLCTGALQRVWTSLG
ncbi:hypothetical protein PR048_010982 [Dryococelus australis]|uniref:Uncharacterized protein n=1 Tax=Dryococelus australis TaxID=614101 RepID=A0ABQ9HKD0_9NEOP|nr:hypothetical protein PR048_010982 [Dryococelus australis]